MTGQHWKQMALIPAVALSAMASGAASPAVAQEDRSVATNVEDGFTLVAGGDLLPSAPVSVTPRNRAVVDVLRSGDVTVANFEAPAVDLRGQGLAPLGGAPGWPLVALSTDIPAFLKDWGFDLVGFANNHTVDWGHQAARDTMRRLREAGIASAGFGENRSGARAPGFFATPKGRVALVAVTATFTENSAASDPFGISPGSPGVSALHVAPVDIVTAEQMQALRAVGAQHNTGEGRFAPATTSGDFTYRGLRFRPGDKPGTVYQVNADDRADILRSVREAKQRANFLVVSIHNHQEPGCDTPLKEGDGVSWPCQMPPDFLQNIARAAIDNGADAIVAHGPHVLLGIEVYKGRPIFYSLGDLFGAVEHVDYVRDHPPAGFDPKHQSFGDYFEKYWAYYARDRALFQSVVAVSRFRDNRLAAIELHPVDLGQSRRQADRGFPETPSPADARVILERLQKLSAPFGTVIAIKDGVGLITMPTQGAKQENRPR